MNLGVGPIPKLHPVVNVFSWCEIPSTTHLSPTNAHSDVWVPALHTVLKVARSRSDRMDRNHASPAPEECSEAQLEFFRKLGFSEAQVRAALLKLGHNSDTNRVLGELVQVGADSEEREGQLLAPVLVPRGDSTSRGHSSLPLSLPFSSSGREETTEDDDALRPIVIDGSNVAMSHGNKEVFSCLGIQLAVNFFLDRGHVDITVFVPSWRKEQPRPDVPITDQHILRELEKRKILVFTPSRRVAGKRVVCYDDRFIVKLAHESGGIIVSNDTYRDLQGERPEWKRFIEQRLLMYSFVNDKFMPPDDPLGRHGPTLDNFLRKTPRALKQKPCPYGKRCTYGIKCKFHHPERAKQSHNSLADDLREKAKLSTSQQRPSSAGPTPACSPPLVMEQKLSLDQWGSSKKGHTSENTLVLKVGPPSSQRKFSSKRERPSRHSPGSLDSFPSGSQERLDSGLGSYERYSPEPPQGHCDRYGGADHWTSKPSTGARHHYTPPNSQPCSCCAHSSPSPSAGFQRHSMGPANSQSPDIMAYRQPCYSSYGGLLYPVNMPQYSLPHDFQQGRVHPPQQGYWSDPYGAYPQGMLGAMQGERNHWAPARAKGNPQEVVREEVRKKLLAIFNARLVDRAMALFPQLMDPQKLAAEILSLQSQNGGLRVLESN